MTTEQNWDGDDFSLFSVPFLTSRPTTPELPVERPPRHRPKNAISRPLSLPRREGARWWQQSVDTCPVSGFPLCYLPYPPFHLKVAGVIDGEDSVYVDGQYLAVKMISECSFEVLGKQLGKKNVEALDSYLGRCKLGKMFKVGDAIADYQRSLGGDEEAEAAWNKRRGQATAKYVKLKEIKARRLARLKKEGKLDFPPIEEEDRSQATEASIDGNLFLSAAMAQAFPYGDDLTVDACANVVAAYLLSELMLAGL